MGEMTELAARRAAVIAVGPWPGNSKSARRWAMDHGTRLGGASHRHAGQVWAEGLRAVYASAAVLGTRAADAAPLAMVAALASHLGACDRCWRTGPYDSLTPAQWVTWACARRPGVAMVLAPVMVELAGRRLDRSLASLRPA